MSLFRLLLGELTWKDLDAASPNAAIVYVLLYFCVLIFLMVNMVLGINYRQKVINYRQKVNNYRQKVINYRQNVINYRQTVSEVLYVCLICVPYMCALYVMTLQSFAAH